MHFSDQDLPYNSKYFLAFTQLLYIILYIFLMLLES